MKAITLNDLALNVESPTLSYADIVRMSGNPPGTHLTITVVAGDRGFTVKSGETLALEDGMVISAVDTSRA